jgi:hypothetical protein
MKNTLITLIAVAVACFVLVKIYSVPKTTTTVVPEGGIEFGNCMFKRIDNIMICTCSNGYSCGVAMVEWKHYRPELK